MEILCSFVSSKWGNIILHEKDGAPERYPLYINTENDQEERIPSVLTQEKGRIVELIDKAIKDMKTWGIIKIFGQIKVTDNQDIGEMSFLKTGEAAL